MIEITCDWRKEWPGMVTKKDIFPIVFPCAFAELASLALDGSDKLVSGKLRILCTFAPVWLRQTRNPSGSNLQFYLVGPDLWQFALPKIMNTNQNGQIGP